MSAYASAKQNKKTDKRYVRYKWPFAYGKQQYSSDIETKNGWLFLYLQRNMVKIWVCASAVSDRTFTICVKVKSCNETKFKSLIWICISFEFFARFIVEIFGNDDQTCFSNQ